MIHVLLLCVMLSGGCAKSGDMNFTASTPACKAVRDFLRISQVDSIDFIRWKLKILKDETFELSCNYGMSKANTNGFVNERKIKVKGRVALSDELVILRNGNKTLSMLRLNSDILHLLNSDGTLMVGNGGWSYTLNSLNPLFAGDFNLKAKEVSFKDSIVFDGRTPCKGMAESAPGSGLLYCLDGWYYAQSKTGRQVY